MAQWTFSTQNVAFFCMQRRYERSALLEAAQIMPSGPCGPRWQFGNELPTAVRGGAEYLKELHRMGDGRIFFKNLRASLFNKDLSNEPLLDPSRWTVPLKSCT